MDQIYSSYYFFLNLKQVCLIFWLTQLLFHMIYDTTSWLAIMNTLALTIVFYLKSAWHTPGDRYWNATAIGTASRILIYTWHIWEIRQKSSQLPSRLIGPWRPYDCNVIHTWGNGTVPIAVTTVFVGFLTFIWFCYLIYATITSNKDGIRGRLSYLSWQIMTATAQWAKFFIFKFSLKKCSNYMSPGGNIKLLSL